MFTWSVGEVNVNISKLKNLESRSISVRSVKHIIDRLVSRNINSPVIDSSLVAAVSTNKYSTEEEGGDIFTMTENVLKMISKAVHSSLTNLGSLNVQLDAENHHSSLDLLQRCSHIKETDDQRCRSLARCTVK